MIRKFTKRYSPIGIDVGSHSVKLLQLNATRSEVIEKARWDVELAEAQNEQQFTSAVTDAIRQARAGRRFRGRRAVICLNSRHLFVQNVRVSKSPDLNLAELVEKEAAERIPYPSEETDLRYLEPGDIRQGDSSRREVIMMACHRPVLDQFVESVLDAGLKPIAVDTEPTAILRCYTHQYRRDEDQDSRVMYVHVGAANTSVLIAQGTLPLFVKYLDIGGSQMDDAVARNLGMEPDAARLLRSHNGDRRRAEQDPEVAAEVAQAVRPVIDRLANEVSLCVRYHSVTFRGQPLSRTVIGGGEATQGLVEALGARLNLTCDLGSPFLRCKNDSESGRDAQWDVATGLALREVA